MQRKSSAELDALKAKLTLVEDLLDRNVPAQRKQGIQLYFASEAAKDLTKFSRLSIPDRPDELMLGHEDLREFVVRVSRSNRVSPADVQKGALFGSWREAVLRIEGLNAGRVEVLIHLARVFEPIPDHLIDFKTIVDFTAMTWGLRMPPVPPPVEARRIASQFTRHMNELPMILRDVDFHERPQSDRRGGEPTRISQLSLSSFDGEDDDDREEAPF